MLVLSDVLLTVGIVDDKRHVKRFIDTKMLNKRDDFGQKEFDICYVPSGNSAVSQFQIFALYHFLKFLILVASGTKIRHQIAIGFFVLKN